MSLATRLLSASALALALLAASPHAAAQCAPATATGVLDANNVSATLLNNGVLFFNGAGVEAAYEVPKGSGLSSIFAGGLWAGGQVDGEIRTAAATYGDFEFWAGPIVDGQPPADCSAFDRIYVVSQADIDAYDLGGAPAPDLAQWPAALGAPVADGDGIDGNYNLRNGDRPELQGAAQTAWWVMNDLGGPHANTGTEPIGLEVRVQALSFVPDGGDIPAVADESTFYQYTLIYQGEGTLEEFYVSLWLDVDLGEATDDYVGSRPDVRLGYTYNADDNDAQYGTTPPAVGVYGIDAFSGDLGALREGSFFARSSGGERSPVSSLMYFINQTGTPQSDPSSGIEVYNYLRARWIDGTRLVFGGSGYDPADGVPTAYAFSGDAPDYWSENDALPADGPQPNAAGDRRSLQTFGPFTLESGQAVELLTGILWTRADGGAIASLDALVAAAAELNDGGPDAPEPIFGNTLAGRTISVPRNLTDTLVLPLSNPGDATLTYTLEGGAGPGSPFLSLPDGEQTLASGGDAPVNILVSPDGAAVGTYLAEIVVRSNDRNVVSAVIPVTISVTAAVAGEDTAADTFALRAPAPNPAAGRTQVEYQTAQAGPVRLTVLDALGREVAVVVDEQQGAGAHEAWLPLDTLPSGVYVVRLRAGEREATQQLTVVR